MLISRTSSLFFIYFSTNSYEQLGQGWFTRPPLRRGLVRLNTVRGHQVSHKLSITTPFARCHSHQQHGSLYNLELAENRTKGEDLRCSRQTLRSKRAHRIDHERYICAGVWSSTDPQERPRNNREYWSEEVVSSGCLLGDGFACFLAIISTLNSKYLISFPVYYTFNFKESIVPYSVMGVFNVVFFYDRIFFRQNQLISRSMKPFTILNMFCIWIRLNGDC